MQRGILFILVGLAVGGGLGYWWAQRGEVATGTSMPVAEDFVSLRASVAALPFESISAEERAGLVYMREEEKLARDVYRELFATWQLPIFENIAQSEATHTEAVRTLLDKYRITDPVIDDGNGTFVNPDLAALYAALVAQGKQSLEDALIVGATIEDLDIKDIADQLAQTDNQDIQMVYQQLVRGSRNHLRAFYGQLTKRGATYAPQYITQDVFDSIVSTAQERGR